LKINAKVAVLLIREEAKVYAPEECDFRISKRAFLANDWKLSEKSAKYAKRYRLLPEGSSQKSAKNSSMGIYLDSTRSPQAILPRIPLDLF